MPLILDEALRNGTSAFFRIASESFLKANVLLSGKNDLRISSRSAPKLTLRLSDRQARMLVRDSRTPCDHQNSHLQSRVLVLPEVRNVSECSASRAANNMPRCRINESLQSVGVLQLLIVGSQFLSTAERPRSPSRGQKTYHHEAANPRLGASPWLRHLFITRAPEPLSDFSGHFDPVFM